MALSLYKRAVGVFSSRRDAEDALHELHNSAFPMNKVSIIARDADKQDDIAGVDVSDRVGNKADEGAATGALTGGAIGGFTGLLVGLGALAIPGVGPVLLAGEVATALATTLAGGAIGAAAGSLIGALVGLGIPEEQARVYNERVSKGEYLVLVDGNEAELAKVETILTGRGIQYFGIYDQPDSTTTRAVNVVDASIIAPTSATYVEPSTSSVDSTPSVQPGTSTSNDPQVIIIDHRREENL